MRPPFVGRLVLFEASYLLAYRFGMSYTRDHAAPFWFPDSVLLAALLVSPPATWWRYILGTLPIRIFSFVPSATPFWFPLARFANDSLKVSSLPGCCVRPQGNGLVFEKLQSSLDLLICTFRADALGVGRCCNPRGSGLHFLARMAKLVFRRRVSQPVADAVSDVPDARLPAPELQKRSRYVEALS